MSDAIGFFANRLIVGLAMALTVLARLEATVQTRPSHVVGAYYRIQMLLILGLAVLVGLAAPGQKWGSLLIGAAAFAGSVVWLMERRGAGRLLIYVVFAAALAQLFALVSGMEGARAVGGLIWPSSLSSAMTLGAAMSGMLLGH